MPQPIDILPEISSVLEHGGSTSSAPTAYSTLTTEYSTRCFADSVESERKCNRYLAILGNAQYRKMNILLSDLSLLVSITSCTAISLSACGLALDVVDASCGCSAAFSLLCTAMFLAFVVLDAPIQCPVEQRKSAVCYHYPYASESYCTHLCLPV